jgi:hypothetical protein
VPSRRVGHRCSSSPIRGSSSSIKANQGVIKLHQGQSGGSSSPIRGVIKLAPAPCPHQVRRVPRSIRQSGGHQGQSGGSSSPIRGSSSSIKVQSGGHQAPSRSNHSSIAPAPCPHQVGRVPRSIRQSGGHQAPSRSNHSSVAPAPCPHQGSSRPIRGFIKLAPAPCPHQVGHAPQSIRQGPRPPPDHPTAHEAAPRSCPPPSPHAAHGPPRTIAAAARRAGVACQLGVNQGTIRGQLGVAPESPVRHVAIKVN